MPTITNKTVKPLSVSLSGGKKLHLGPLKSAGIAERDVERPQVQKLVDAGEVEIDSGGQGPSHRGGGDKGSAKTSGARGQGGTIRHGGDR